MSIIYTRPALRHLLGRARLQGLDLAQGSPLETMTVAQLAELVKERENNMNDISKAVSPLSARQRAEDVLAFREAHAPNNTRFVHRALLVDNGERGSAQKAATFDGDDLSALMQDYASLERELAAARETADAAHTGREQAEAERDTARVAHANVRTELLAFGAELTALRERHAEAVEQAIRWTIEQVNRDMAQEGQQCCLSPELALARHHARTATERPPFDGRRVDTAGMTPMGEKK